MKYIFLLFALLITSNAWAAVPTTSQMVWYGTDSTASCTSGHIMIDTDATSGQRVYVCESSVWVLQGDGGGSVEGTAVLSTGETGGTKFLREDGDGTSSWQTPTGGDVVGPASATDSVPALFDTTTGKLLKNSTPTGTGNPVLATSPTLVTPTLGVASATSINKVAFTAPATSATLALVDGTTITGPAATGTLVTQAGTSTLTNKTIAFGSNTLTNVMSTSTAQSVTAGIKKTFQANATNAGLRLAGVTANPSSPAAGDLWYRSDTPALMYYDSGAKTVANLAGTQTLTNKTISDASNTVTLTRSKFFSPQSAKLTGAFVVFTPTSADATTQGAAIDAGDGNWRLLFDATTDEGAMWQWRLPDKWSGHSEINVPYTMTSATSGTVEYEAAVMCVSDGDLADIGTASFAAVAVGSATVPGTAGYLDEISITVTDDSCAAGDMFFLFLSTDANDGTNDTATGDREVLGVEYEYTT